MRYYKIWLPLLSIVLLVSLAELICRGFDLNDKFDADFKFYINNIDNDLNQEFMIEDAFLMWSLKPNYSKGDIAINSEGFRDKEYKVKKDKNVFRILCLGDSSTFGWHVQPQETYHALLEKRLNEKSGKNSIKYEVINSGVTGYTSYQGLRLYERKGLKFQPDIVTFYFGANDLRAEFYLSDKEIIPNDVPAVVKAMIENNLLLKLNSYRLLRKFMVNVFGIHKDRIKEKVTRVAKEDFKENILELNRLCQKNGSLLLLISPPVNKEEAGRLNIQTQIDSFRKELKNLSVNYKIPLLYIPEMTEESPLDTMLFFSDLYHPNQLGHRRIMDRLYDYLVINKLLP